MRRIYLPLASLVIGIVCDSVFAQQSDEDLLAKLKQQGMPISLSELEPKMLENGLKSDDNAAVHLKRAAKAAAEFDVQLDAFRLEWHQPAHQEFVGEFNRLTTKFPALYADLEQAVEAAQYLPELNYRAKPNQFLAQANNQNGFLRRAARILMYRSKVLVFQQEYDEAARDAIRMLKLARHSRQLPTLMGHLGACSVTRYGLIQLNHVLQLGEISSEVRKEIDDELARHDSLKSLKTALITERAFGISFIKEQGITALFAAQGYLSYLERQVANAEKPAFEYEDDADPQTLGPLVGQLMPAVQQSRNAANRTLAQVRALRIINGLQSSLSEEPDLDGIELPDDAKTDPFTGEPMIVKQKDDGWLVYSIGRNGQDDGGDVIQERDFGFGPTK